MDLITKNTYRYSALLLIIAAFLITSKEVCAQDRSEDKDKPTQVTTKEITDDLNGSEDAYYYRFSVAPGKLTITFEVTAEETNAGAHFDLFDTRWKQIVSGVLAQGVDKGSERVVKTITSAKARDIILRVKGIKYGSSSGVGTYMIRFEGPLVTPPGTPGNNAN